MVDLQLIISLILSIVPLIELRGALPLVVDYSLKNSLSIWPYFAIIVFLNIIVIFFIFIFLDFAHVHLLKLNFYKKFFNYYLNKIRTKSEKVNSKIGLWKYVMLGFFVAIPLPGTGAWTGTFIAWMLKLNRIKSFIAIALGVLFAGLLILLFSFYGLKFFY